MHVVFIHGPAASGKHTIGTRVSAITGLPLFHNHLAVDAAKPCSHLARPGSTSCALRATVWLTAFTEAAASGQSFIFTFHPEASVDPATIAEMVDVVHASGGKVLFVELACSTATVLERLPSPGPQPAEIAYGYRYFSLQLPSLPPLDWMPAVLPPRKPA